MTKQIAEATNRYHVQRPAPRGGLLYAQSVDDIGADWGATRKALTRAEVAAIVRLCDTRTLDIRDYETFQPVDLAEVEGYVGQDENDEAIYDPALAWGAK